MSETDKPNDWLVKIHSSHSYFFNKTNLAPTKLFLHPRIRLELFNQLQKYDSFTLCDRGITKFMGCEVLESVDVKDFLWALTVEE